MGSKFLNLNILIFLLSSQFFAQQNRIKRLSFIICREFGQKWPSESRFCGGGQNSWKWAISPESRFSTFWRKFWFLRYRPNFGAIDPIFSLLPNNCLYVRVLPWLIHKPWFLGWFEGGWLLECDLILGLILTFRSPDRLFFGMEWVLKIVMWSTHAVEEFLFSTIISILT